MATYIPQAADGAALPATVVPVAGRDGGGLTQALATDASGELQVDVLTMPGTAAEAAALPSQFVVVAGDDGTDTQPLQLSAGGDLKITLDSETVTVVQSTATSLKTQAECYQGGTAVASGTPLFVATADRTDTLFNGATAETPAFTPIGAATSGNNTLKTAGSGKLRVLAMFIVAGAAGNIYFTSGAGGSVIFGDSTNKINLAANGGFVLPYNPVGWFETGSAAALVMNASSTGPFSGGMVTIDV